MFGWGALGSWNDIGLPAFPQNTYFSVVEYNVPEPATLLLVGGLLAARRRFSRKLAK